MPSALSARQDEVQDKPLSQHKECPLCHSDPAFGGGRISGSSWTGVSVTNRKAHILLFAFEMPGPTDPNSEISLHRKSGFACSIS